MTGCDFHMHTSYSDGKNTAEEMVLQAIKLGLHSVGIAEHMTVSFDIESCMSEEVIPLYKNEMKRLKSKYGDRIKVLCGIEYDYDSDVRTDDLSEYDYIIGSVHYLKVNNEIYSVDLSPDETKRCVINAFGGDYDAYAEAYFEKVARLKQKTDVDIIGHFDLITKFRDRGASPDENSERYIKAYKSALDELCGSAVFEVNTGAITRGYRTTPYPSDEILREIKKRNGGVILSSDAHSKDGICAHFDECREKLVSLEFESAGFYDRHGVYYSQF